MHPESNTEHSAWSVYRPNHGATNVSEYTAGTYVKLTAMTQLTMLVPTSATWSSHLLTMFTRSQTLDKQKQDEHFNAQAGKFMLCLFTEFQPVKLMLPT